MPKSRITTAKANALTFAIVQSPIKNFNNLTFVITSAEGKMDTVSGAEIEEVSSLLLQRAMLLDILD
jgi:hypothetical protein